MKGWKDYSSIGEFSSLGGAVYLLKGCPGNLTPHIIILLALPSPGKLLGPRQPDGRTDVWAPPCPVPPPPNLPPHQAWVQELVMGHNSFLCKLGLTFPPSRGACLGLKAEPPLGPLIQNTPPKKNHRPGHTLLNCGKRELDFIQKVYKIQKADNSLTVSQKNK